MIVRAARPDERLEVLRLLDAALLEVEGVDARLEAGDVLVAVDDSSGRLVGTIVLEPEPGGAHVSAVAVRRRRRDRGIGTALIERALEREGRLTARFDERVRPFYESLEFSIERIDERRYQGKRGG
ncbi:GNAT family N-acetyltransferase [Natronobeatus ordinarius]|uniref:GNAT family N-acetyltransferase n=1 Tax=Natronobeatus ordinarius TaxID=2963433 RepID=UPI0020CD8B7B|nr:GNAT family N-acetyltransferase [Natronobeatus ordinarius]